MGKLKSTPTPEKALQELKKSIKEGRDLIGRGEWQTLLALINDIKELIEYLHNWSDVLTYDKLQYKPQMTNILLRVLVDAREQIMFEYPDKNIYGFPLEIDGNSQKKRAVSKTWDIIETAFNMADSYGSIKEETNLGIYDKYGKKAKTRSELPKDLRDVND